jgi:hypothetical protein
LANFPVVRSAKNFIFLFYSFLWGESKPLFPLLTFTFAILFSVEKQACGPEARALGGKSIGGKRNPIEDPTVLPQNEAGPSGAQPAPLHRDTPVLRERTACPPGPRKGGCFMVFARNALAFGPGNA